MLARAFDKWNTFDPKYKSITRFEHVVAGLMVDQVEGHVSDFKSIRKLADFFQEKGDFDAVMTVTLRHSNKGIAYI